jgi:hypothetical protein
MPPSSLVESCDVMESKSQKANLGLYYFGDLSGELFNAYTAAAKNDSISDDFNFYHMADTACGEKFGLSGAGIALSRTFDNSPLQYSGGANGKEIASWALESSLPELIPYSKQYAKAIMGS